MSKSCGFIVFIFATLLLILVTGRKSADPVTCGSVIKLIHKETVFLQYIDITLCIHTLIIVYTLFRETIYILMV